MPAAALVLLLLGAWEAYVRLGGIDDLILPAPTQVAQALYDDRGLLAEDLLVTSYEVLAGLAAAAVLGAGTALLMHRFRLARQALLPLVIGSQAVPVPVIAVLILFVVGFGLALKVVIVALVCFFPIAVNLYDGLRRADPDARKLLQSYGATRTQTLRYLEAPAALPAAFTGLKVAAAVAVIGAVFGEWAGSSDGLGHTVLVAGGQLETDRAFAATVLLFLLAIALYGLVSLLERRVVPWAPRHTERGT
jgi:NitT/TauT family transport system permease protein/putative hydroxymethylpyrimidine transport system permease protein